MYMHLLLAVFQRFLTQVIVAELIWLTVVTCTFIVFKLRINQIAKSIMFYVLSYGIEDKNNQYVDIWTNVNIIRLLVILLEDPHRRDLQQ